MESCRRCEQRIGDAVGLTDKEIDAVRHEMQAGATSCCSGLSLAGDGAVLL